MSDSSRLAGCNVPVKMTDHSLGQVVTFYLAFNGQGSQLGGQSPVAADDPPNQPFMGQVVHPPVPAVPLAGGINQG